MSLNQKYTWNDFLKENPELKAKEIKRTSSEGKKAFEAAFKAKAKDVLKDRLLKIEKETARTTKKRDNLVTEMKASKKIGNKRKIQKKVGKSDKYLHNLTKMTKKTKEVQKSI